MENINIVYDDNHITVCVKPPFLLSQQDCKGSPHMLQKLDSLLNTSHKVIHRLDFGVGGIMVYAKTYYAAAKLSEAVRNNCLQKEYIAVVCGKPQERSGIYKDLLFKDSAKNKTYVVNRMRKGVREASLEYRVLDTKETEKGELSLVWIKLHTGRTHQIRVQFASRKTPVYGDSRYGSKTTDKKCALWSYRLTFDHPAKKEIICLQSLPDCDFPWNVFNCTI